MRKFLSTLVLITCFGLAIAATAQETSEQPAVSAPPITIKRAQISGLSDEVVTVVYTEGKRKVYDPVLVTPETEIWWGKKTVSPASLRRSQYLKVVGSRQNETIVAQRIDILTSAPVVKAAPKPTVKAALKSTTTSTPKPVVKPAPKPVITQPAKTTTPKSGAK